MDALCSSSREHHERSMNTIGVGLVKRGANYYAVEDFAAPSTNSDPTD